MCPFGTPPFPDMPEHVIELGTFQPRGCPWTMLFSKLLSFAVVYLTASFIFPFLRKKPYIHQQTDKGNL